MPTSTKRNIQPIQGTNSNKSYIDTLTVAIGKDSRNRVNNFLHFRANGCAMARIHDINAVILGKL